MVTKPTGNPVGRPSFKPTPAMRSDVAIWKAGGMTNKDIGHALGIDEDTVIKHFRAELDVDWAKKVAVVVKAQFDAARKGNVTAQTRFLERARAVAGEANFGSQKPAERRERIVPIGKKEAAEEAAKSAGLGTEWGDDLQPRTALQ